MNVHTYGFLENAFHRTMYGWEFATFCILVFGGAALVFFLPTIIAIKRRLNWSLFFVANLVFGCTVVGWFVVFWFALTSRKPEDVLRAEHDFLRGAIADGVEDALIPQMRRLPSSPLGHTIARRAPGGDRFNRREPPSVAR